MGLVLYRELPIFTLNCHILHAVRASSLQAWQQMLLEGYQSLLGKPKVERDTEGNISYTMSNYANLWHTIEIYSKS